MSKLEAEKQEPVAWIDRTCLKNLSDDFEPTIGKRPVSEYDIPLYTHPQPKREQEPVACQHKRYSIDVTEQIGTCIDCGSEGRMHFVVDDTHPKPEAEKQEPFGIWHQGLTEDESDFYLLKDSGDVSCPDCIKLYTHPQPKREPLTDEQILALWEDTYVQRGSTGIEFARAIEVSHGIKEST